MDHIHHRGDLKTLTVENIEKYVIEDERLALLFNRMKDNGRKVFLMTNSGFEYTDVGQRKFIINDYYLLILLNID